MGESIVVTLNSRELSAVCLEIATTLGSRTVQKVVQPDERSLYLGFPREWLCLSIDPALGRIHLTEKPAGTGEAAPAFCMLLRKHLIGRKLTGVTAVLGERAMELDLEDHRLLLFLYGRSSQLVLLDQTGRALGAIGGARVMRTELPPARERDDISRFGDAPGISVRIEAHFHTESETRGTKELRERATREIKSQLERQRRLETALAGDLERVDDASQRRIWADLIFAHLGEIPRGAKSITLPNDFVGEGEVVIKLDPALSAKKNAEKLYKDHKRLERARTRIAERLAEVRTAAAETEARLSALATLPDDQLVGQVSARAVAKKSKRQKSVVRPPYNEFRSATGGVILVGRGADKNDELTFKVARGADLWLHSRDVPGAHVIVPLQNGRSVDEQTLLDAATLAAHHSHAREEGQVDITYTLRKNVRKPSKSPPGTVLTSNTKTIRVRLEPTRLARLLKSRTED